MKNNRFPFFVFLSKKINYYLFAAVFCILLVRDNTDAQCTVTSTCGYTVTFAVNATAIIPSTYTCPYGYNYNVQFTYSVTVSGKNTCYTGNVQIQPLISCNGGQSNGYYSITVPAPATGGGSTTNTYTGTVTSSTNPYCSSSNCNTVTVSTFCNNLTININGPGISSSGLSCGTAFSSGLPIQLISFTGKCNDDGVLLNWSTASQVNNNFFTIERTLDGINWNTIKTVEGAGNSSEIINYSFLDTNSYTGVAYYRLQQTDFDGNTKTFNDIAVDNCTKALPVFIISPNPNQGRFTIRLNTYAPNYNVSIYNILGKSIYTANVTSAKTEIYLCRILSQQGQIISSGRFIVQ